MNSDRFRYSSLDRRSTWSPLAVVGLAVSLGVVAGLWVSSPASSFYAAPTVAATTASQTVRVSGMAQQTMSASTSSNLNEPSERFVWADEPSNLEDQSTSAPSTSWAGALLIPVAAVAGFFLGSSSKGSKPATLGPIEVVIDDGMEDIAMAATTGEQKPLYAVVAIGGHQYKVQPGEILSVEKLPLEVGDEFQFEKVLMVTDGEKVSLGHPYLAGATVTAEILRNTKGKKIRIFKYRAKKHTRLAKGHRQKYMQIHVTEVAGHKVPSKVNFAELAAQAAV